MGGRTGESDFAELSEHLRDRFGRRKRLDLDPPHISDYFADAIPGRIEWEKAKFGRPQVEPYSEAFAVEHLAQEHNPDIGPGGPVNRHDFIPVERPPVLLATVEDETTYRIPFWIFIEKANLRNHKITFSLRDVDWSDQPPRPKLHVRVVYPNYFAHQALVPRPPEFGPVGLDWRRLV